MKTLLDGLLPDPELMKLRGEALPFQAAADVALLESAIYVAMDMRALLFEGSPGSRFKKVKTPWKVGVLATCVGFTLGASPGLSTFAAENRRYLTQQLDIAQIGAGSLLEDREFSAHCAHAYRVLAGVFTGAGIKIKDPIALLLRLTTTWVIVIQTLRECPEVGLDPRMFAAP